jgi:hypothetical protein
MDCRSLLKHVPDIIVVPQPSPSDSSSHDEDPRHGAPPRDVISRHSSIDTTASVATTGAEDADDDLEDDDLDEELAGLSSGCVSLPPNLLLCATGGDSSGASSPMMYPHHLHPNTPVASSASAAGNDDEEKDAFPQQHFGPALPAATRAYARPVPALHPLNLNRANLPLLHVVHTRQVPLPSPSTPSAAFSAVTSPFAPPEVATAPIPAAVPATEGAAAAASMSRSISDSTLRRAALHLNLSQSVLPSFTSLQQFKVFIG